MSDSKQPLPEWLKRLVSAGNITLLPVAALAYLVSLGFLSLLMLAGAVFSLSVLFAAAFIAMFVALLFWWFGQYALTTFVKISTIGSRKVR